MKKCSKCKQTKQYEEFNKDCHIKCGYRSQCRECYSSYLLKNPDRIVAIRHKHYSVAENKQKRRDYNREYVKQKRKTNPLIALKFRIRNRTRKVFKDKLGRKCSESISSLLGCTPAFFKQYFESKFTQNMTWDDVYSGKIHIDHIIPISSATTEEELKKLSHYTNLQPLWAVDNLKKSDKFL